MGLGLLESVLFGFGLAMSALPILWLLSEPMTLFVEYIRRLFFGDEYNAEEKPHD
jgi:hypothetical protein